VLEANNAASASASPGLKAGRGLKRELFGQPVRIGKASPGLKAGRGLKRVRRAKRRAEARFARPQSRARIETLTCAAPPTCCTRLRPASKPGAD